MDAPLTERQHQVLRFIEEYRRENGIAPTLEEVGRHLRVHRVTVFGHVEELIRKGYLEKAAPLASRSLRVVAASEQEAKRPTLPLLGTIAAGSPLEAIENPEAIDVDDLVPSGPDVYVLKVKGDSMIEDGIHDGDWILVQRRSTARSGETVVAVLDGGEATLKRFYREGSRFRLEPANRALSPIVTDRVEIRGVVIGLLRRYGKRSP
ncbi:MAG: transcriptional repressor LexA [Planctomycetes bacterium]|nr:transcriptional repressor LexA [Planctomycetota bacterium]